MISAGTSATTNRKALRVALIDMPFASSRRPSIQLGLLQAILAARNIPARTLYLNLLFGRLIGWDTYEVLCNHRGQLLGEWLFSRAAFGAEAPGAEGYLDRFGEALAEIRRALGWDAAYLHELREQVIPAFVDSCITLVPWGEFDVIGFSSIFEQNCAALALARRLKEREPRLVTVFGGANLEDEMGVEYIRALPWIDYAVIGEGDEVFPALLERLAQGADPDGLPGVAHRDASGQMCFSGRAPQVSDLDALPEPAYEDFFATVQAAGVPELAGERPISLPFETARGCWWGQKHHCTFCGLNGRGMAYRSKSPERALAGIDTLARRHLNFIFTGVDNILDQRYIDELFVPLAEQRRDYTFFYEVKANLTAAQLKKLSDGGVRRLQPGIESLSTHLLSLMKKGTTAIQNVRLLKWARYYDVGVAWNVLLGFPGELPEDYERQLAVFRLIPHLQPPNGASRIWLERFSPYFENREQHGFTNIRPDAAYAHVYPPCLDRERIAYFFSYEASGTLPDTAYAETRAAVAEWQARWRAERRPTLLYQRGAGRLAITDGRGGGAPTVHVFGERAALTYEACALTARSAGGVLDDLISAGTPATAESVAQDLEVFCRLGLMLEERGHYLSLALPANRHW